MSRTVLEIKIVVSQATIGEDGKVDRGHRHAVKVYAETATFPSWTLTAGTARGLGREAVKMVLDRDNMLVQTFEGEVTFPDTDLVLRGAPNPSTPA